jgi:hydrogenase nickel incorporation protein HypA/HybF
MHELAVCQSILAQAAAIAAANKADRVQLITLRIGRLAGIEPDLLRAAFPLVAHGTCCEAATLRIETVAVDVECRLCGTTRDVAPNRLLCGSCGTWRVTLRGGNEMRLESLELASLPAEEFSDV